MDLAYQLQELAVRIPSMQAEGLVKTEEGAKHSLVMPFIQALGYNVFNPGEVRPELVADVGIKKGEKVDYAIMKNGKPAILFECKGMGVDLGNVHMSQLFRYFTTSTVRFGVLTNGIQYRFYSDLDKSNRMDEHPFFTFDLLNYSDSQLETLRQFSKETFDEAATVSNALNLRQRNMMRVYIDKLFNDPSDAFVKMAIKDSGVHDGAVTQAVTAQFSKVMREVLTGYIGDEAHSRLKAALKTRDSDIVTVSAAAIAPEAQETPQPVPVVPENKVVTTVDEMDAYFAVKSIVREDIPVKRVALRDALSYCSVLIDDNNRRPLCRFYFNGKQQKYVSFFTADAAKTEEKVPIATIDDIYQHAARLKATATYYSGQSKE